MYCLGVFGIVEHSDAHIVRVRLFRRRFHLSNFHIIFPFLTTQLLHFSALNRDSLYQEFQTNFLITFITFIIFLSFFFPAYSILTSVPYMPDRYKFFFTNSSVDSRFGHICTIELLEILTLESRVFSRIKGFKGGSVLNKGISSFLKAV